MLLCKNSVIRLIGYAESTITQESLGFLSQEHHGTIEIVSPEWFVSTADQELLNFTYGVAFTLDQSLRSQVIQQINRLDLDCITYIHPSAICYFDTAKQDQIINCVGRGTFIGPQSIVLVGSKIGQHCIVEAQCLIAHHASVGNNVQMHPGVIIAGRSTVGNDCVFNLKSAVLPKVEICDNVEIGAISTVTKNIELSGRYVGSPVRRVGDRIAFVERN